jgi:hypothetical protein
LNPTSLENYRAFVGKVKIKQKKQEIWVNGKFPV